MTTWRRWAVEMATLWKLQNGFHQGLGQRAQNARCPHSHKPFVPQAEKGANTGPITGQRRVFESR